jgi:excisionase family DNA binding protein
MTARLLTKAATADLLSVSVRQVERWIRAGRLGVVRLGPRCVRVPVSSIDRLQRRAAD